MNTSKFVFGLSLGASFVCSFVAVASYAESLPSTREPVSTVRHEARAHVILDAPYQNLQPREITIPTVVITAPRLVNRALTKAPESPAKRWGCKPSDHLLSDETATARSCAWY